jgi:ribosomal protein L7Ae-like RNA K-turn-binding protein
VIIAKDALEVIILLIGRDIAAREIEGKLLLTQRKNVPLVITRNEKELSRRVAKGKRLLNYLPISLPRTKNRSTNSLSLEGKQRNL